ncbi:MAG TPA: caspase family protein [Nitrososphaeraceae archaeon]|nr:caspase family protein [Nitrososphaeraceae archaeon]
MSDEEKNENRRAIVIGINEYESSSITQLGGAENDAKEVCETFIKNCNFQVSDNHLLLGKKATRKNILKAISDVFRKDIKCDLVTFYFSGHGCNEQMSKKGYIAPYDMDPEDPFVSGIEMDSIKNTMFNSKNYASVMMILDCCFAGISTEATKSMTSLTHDQKEKDLYNSNLTDLINSSESGENSPESYATGKIVLASSEPDAVSRERDFVHVNKDEPAHPHGNFSFHLIEGLNGKAADPDTGIINIYSLRNYVSSEMEREKGQKPLYAISQGSYKLENIKLGTSPAIHNAKISDLIKCTKEYFEQRDPITKLIDIQALDDASKKIGELIKVDDRNREINNLKAIVNDELGMYKEPAINWLSNNYRIVRPKLNQNIKMDFYEELVETVQSLNFDKLLKSDASSGLLLIHLFSEVKRNNIFQSPEDERLGTFIGRLRAACDIKNKKDLM